MVELSIPRHFHWIWLGGGNPPEQHQEWMRGWLRHHPSWSWTLWREQDLPRLVNHVEFSEARSWAQKADVARYEVLLTHGGVYLDTDMECMRSIEPLLHGRAAVVGAEHPDLLGNAFLAAVPGSSWMQAVVEALPVAMRHQRLTLDQTGPGLLTKISAARDDVAVLPPELLYPFTSESHGGDPPPTAFAVHRWARSWEQSEVAHVREELSRALADVLDPGDVLVLVAEGVLVDLPEGCRVRPFLEVDGVDWGAPADGASATARVRAHVAAGVHWLIFLFPAFWWLEHYEGLEQELIATAQERVENGLLRAFRLQPEP